MAAFERLRRDGKIRHWGVSNLDADDMVELLAVPDGARCAANQVLYNLSRRGIEWDLLPWCREHGIPVMAYSPIEQGRLATKGVLTEIAQRHGCSPFQVALAWALAQPGVVAIPKASRLEHVEANAAAARSDPHSRRSGRDRPHIPTAAEQATARDAVRIFQLRSRRQAPGPARSTPDW